MGPSRITGPARTRTFDAANGFELLCWDLAKRCWDSPNKRRWSSAQVVGVRYILTVGSVVRRAFVETYYRYYCCIRNTELETYQLLEYGHRPNFDAYKTHYPRRHLRMCSSQQEKSPPSGKVQRTYCVNTTARPTSRRNHPPEPSEKVQTTSAIIYNLKFYRHHF